MLPSGAGNGAAALPRSSVMGMARTSSGRPGAGLSAGRTVAAAAAALLLLLRRRRLLRECAAARATGRALRAALGRPRVASIATGTWGRPWRRRRRLRATAKATRSLARRRSWWATGGA
ncbi:Hypothetical predicted protein [Podarcis lilfordi]|uniref:Uncharacterized protein n=1 Tax=Podarcis lilfordi TaxID=74358 RepID=A0AA35K3V0_9SAUR|nr:Hypothetical predicted protein [Podarcis lilfordi]